MSEKIEECFLDIIEALSRRDWRRIEEICRWVAEQEKSKGHINVARTMLEALDIAMEGFDSVAILSSHMVEEGDDD